MADMLSTALFHSNRYIVLERQQVSDVLREQDLGAAGRIKKGTEAPIGEIEGAELLITGAVTEFEGAASGRRRRHRGHRRDRGTRPRRHRRAGSRRRTWRSTCA